MTPIQHWTWPGCAQLEQGFDPVGRTWKYEDITGEATPRLMGISAGEDRDGLTTVRDRPQRRPPPDDGEAIGGLKAPPTGDCGEPESGTWAMWVESFMIGPFLQFSSRAAACLAATSSSRSKYFSLTGRMSALAMKPMTSAPTMMNMPGV